MTIKEALKELDAQRQARADMDDTSRHRFYDVLRAFLDAEQAYEGEAILEELEDCIQRGRYYLNKAIKRRFSK